MAANPDSLTAAFKTAFPKYHLHGIKYVPDRNSASFAFGPDHDSRLMWVITVRRKPDVEISMIECGSISFDKLRLFVLILTPLLK